MTATTTPLVLLPGMMCDRRLWRAQIAAFSADREVIAPTLTDGDSIAQIARSLLSSLPEYFSLAGLSMGGIVAFEIMRQAPHRIDRLALLDTNHRPDTDERRRMRDRQVSDVLAGRLNTVMREELKPNYLAEIHRDNLTLLDEVLAMGLELGEKVFVAQSVALQTRPDSTATLQEIRCPTTVICGAEDALCPPALHRQIHEGIKGSALHIVEDCGHLSPMEQPELVTSLMHEWLYKQ